jgi:heat shock protein HtpX
MVRTTLLLGALTGLMMAIGHYFGGSNGMLIALIFASITNLIGYWFSDKIVLRMYGAREVSESEAPQLYRIVHNLALGARMPMPKVYIIPGESPNAFATGRNPQHAAVAVTEGLMRMMDEREITGVLAHELSHVQNRDILIGSIAATLAGAIMMLADMMRWAAIFGGFRRDGDEEGGGGSLLEMILLPIVASFAAMLIQMAISRTREFAADATGARMCGDPMALASALRKLGFASQRLPMDASPQTAHMFIVNPLSGGTIAKFFSTHPPLEERIARLEAMAGRRAA